MRRKEGIIWDPVISWTVGIGVLVLGFIIYGILSGKLGGMGEFLRNLRLWG